MKSKKVLIPLVIASSLALLFGLAVIIVALFNLFLDDVGLRPLPEEQRYSRIDSVKDEIDFSLAGEIIGEDYRGDGVWSGAHYHVTIKGPGVFEIIAPQLLSAVDSPASCAVTEKSISCISNNNPTAMMSTDGETTTLQLNDTLGGRDAER